MSTNRDANDVSDDFRPTLAIVPTIYPTSLPINEQIDRFWQCGPELADVRIHIEPSDMPLAILEQLGPSPFERGGFPVIGFLATTYDKVSRYALERGAN